MVGNGIIRNVHIDVRIRNQRAENGTVAATFRVGPEAKKKVKEDLSEQSSG